MSANVVVCTQPLMLSREDVIGMAEAFPAPNHDIPDQIGADALRERIGRIAEARLSAGRLLRYREIVAAMNEKGQGSRLGVSDQTLLSVLESATCCRISDQERLLYFPLDFLDADFRDLAMAAVDASPNMLVLIMRSGESEDYRRVAVNEFALWHLSADGDGRPVLVSSPGEM